MFEVGDSTVRMGLTQQRYVKAHRSFRIPLAHVAFHRVGGSQFSARNLPADLEGNTPELGCNFSLEKSYSPSRLKYDHDWGEWIAIIRRSLSCSSGRVSGAYLTPRMGLYPAHRRIPMAQESIGVLSVRCCPLPESTSFPSERIRTLRRQNPCDGRLPDSPLWDFTYLCWVRLIILSVLQL